MNTAEMPREAYPIQSKRVSADFVTTTKHISFVIIPLCAFYIFVQFVLLDLCIVCHGASLQKAHYLRKLHGILSIYDIIMIPFL